MSDRPTCGRCGVYRHLHPVRWCKGYRYSFWWDRHSAARHIAGRLWLALSDARRFNIVDRLHKRRPYLCWCEFVDCAYLDNKAHDYRKPNGCACEIPIPTNIGVPRDGGCYCSPPYADRGARP